MSITTGIGFDPPVFVILKGFLKSEVTSVTKTLATFFLH